MTGGGDATRPRTPESGHGVRHVTSWHMSGRHGTSRDVIRLSSTSAVRGTDMESVERDGYSTWCYFPLSE